MLKQGLILTTMEAIKIAASSGSAHDHGSPSREGEDKSESKAHLEHINTISDDLVYDDAEHEPQLHFRTWVALAAMWLYNYVIVLTLLSPPAVVCSTSEGCCGRSTNQCFRSHTLERVSTPGTSRRGCSIRSPFLKRSLRLSSPRCRMSFRSANRLWSA